MIWKSKTDGAIDYFSKSWTDYSGLSKDQSLGHAWQKVIHPSDLSIFLRSWNAALISGEAFQAECRLRRHDNQMRWYCLRAVPELDSGEKVVSWIGTCTDIHDRRLTERRLIEAERMALSANIAKAHFLANMSHEMRTPLSAILGFAELMLGPDLSLEERTHHVRTICRSGQQLLKIIDEILDISKVESGHMEIEIVDFNLGHLLRDLQTLLSVQAESKGIGLIFHLKSLVPEYVFSDPTRVRQILMNVISNAIKFTKNGKVILETEWIEAQGGRSAVLKFRVQDTGVGIDAAQAEKIFEPFAQVDNSTTRSFGGTGLGLDLSRKVTQALGGSVFLEKSEVGRGSSFVIEIETNATLNTKFIDKIEAPIVNDVEFSTVNDARALAGLKILLVEDAPINQLLISHFLTGAGAEVELAANGAIGMRKALAGDYAVVLMDIQMPEMDGYEATTKLREHGYVRPIIALTAHAQKEDRERSLNAGCTDHLTKPIDRKLLISQISHLASL
jgi:PAS domain S-box-containing protein